jgi:hypothetical protein
VRVLCWTTNLCFGLGLLLTALPAPAGLLALPPTLEQMLTAGEFVVTARVESIDESTFRAVFTVDENLKGVAPFRRLKVSLEGDAEARKDGHRAILLKRLALKGPLVVFGAQHQAHVILFAYADDTWFQVIGKKKGEVTDWAFTHLEPTFRRTFKGTAAQLRQAVADALAGKLAGKYAFPDLTKIDRTIAAGPSYKSKPSYCLLVFGPQAKTRVWLVRDREILYVDRNGNGDLTENGERFVGAKSQDSIHWRIGDIVEADGKTRHTDLRIRFRRGSFLIGLRTADGLHQAVGNEIGRLRFADRAQDAPIVHLAGPLTFLLPENREKRLELVPGQEAHFIALLGTPGLGEGAAAYTHSEDFNKPGALKMVVEAGLPGQAPGGLLRARNVCTDY